MIKVCNCSCKSYISVVSDSEVAHLGEGKDASFRPFLYCVLFIDCVERLEKYFVKLSCLFVEACSFSVFNFLFNIVSSSSSKKCP